MCPGHRPASPPVAPGRAAWPVALDRRGRYGVSMFKKLLFLAIIVGVGFVAAKKLKAA
jgi:hypothetical protein